MSFHQHSIPGSSDSSAIRDHVDNVHAISQKGLDQSSIMECLQDKVEEVRKYKEMVFSLESQVKMVTEAARLQEVEFAFERQEYENEIASLKKRDPVSQVAPKSSTRKIDVEVKLQQATQKSTEFKEKYEKWKARTKSMKQQNRNLELELTRLRKDHSNTKDALVELQTSIEARDAEIDEQMQKSQLLSEETDQVTTKLNKAQERMTEMEEHNLLLKSQLQEQTHQGHEAKEQVKILKTELKKMYKDHKKEMEAAITKTRELTSDKLALEAEIRKMKSQLKAQMMQIENLSAEQSGASDSAMTAISQMSAVEEENQKLRLQIKSLAKQNARMKNAEQELRKSQQLALHCEEEMTNICDVLQVDVCDLSAKWTPISEKCEELLANKDSINHMKTQNEKLQRRLATLIGDRKRSDLQQPQVEADDCLDSVLQTIKTLKDENERKAWRINQLEYEHQFAAHIVNQHSLLTKRISELHSSIFNTESTPARALILAVLFAKRLQKYPTGECVNDASVLTVFGGRLKQAPDCQIAEIREKITSLTEDLVSAKESLALSDSSMHDYADERDHMKVEARTNADKAALASEKLRYMKKRMIELQEELSTLISPEVHNETVERLREAESEIGTLRARVQEFENELENRNAVEQKLHDQIEQAQLAAEQEAVKAEEVRGLVAEKDQQIGALEAILKEKTKEMLALERVVSIQKERSTVDKSSMNALATENRTLRKPITDAFDHRMATASLGGTQTGITGSINPAFL